MVATLAASVALELDLRMEAAAASELYERTRGEAAFRVPHVDWSRTAASVLTSEWIDGISVRDAAAIAAAGHDPKQVAVLVMRSFLTQALRDGFFHADMHPGNLFIDAAGTAGGGGFRHHGAAGCGHAPLHGRHPGGFPAARLPQGGGAALRIRLCAAASFAWRPLPRPCAPSASRSSASSARDVSIARLLGQLFETTRRFDMQAQPQLVLLQKTMVVVEGVCRGLDPDFDIWQAARPVAEKWVQRKHGPGSAR